MKPLAPDGDGPPAPEGPEISFPCSWSYTVIAEEQVGLIEALAAILGDREHRLKRSRNSSGGRYCSFHLEVRVLDDTERLSLFRALQEQDGVRYVL